MKNKTYLSNRIQLYIFLSILFVASVFLAADIITEHVEYAERAKKIRSEYYKHQRETIRTEVEKVYDRITEEKSEMNRLILESTKPLVEQAHRVANFIHAKYKDVKPESEIKQMIIDALTPIRLYEGSQYYFIVDLDAEGVLLNNQPDVAMDLRNYSDPHGNFVLKDMVAIAEAQKEGFYTYYWTKPFESGNDHKKSSYIKLFEPFNWIIGTGVYFEDYEEKLQKELLENIGQIRFGHDRSGYIFIVTYDGTTLMNDTQRDLIGKNLWEMEDIDGLKVIQVEREAVEKPSGGFMEYNWHNPRTGKASKKASFVKGIKDWQWMIGAGFYYDDIDPQIEALHDDIYNDNIQEFSEYLVVLFFLTLFMLAIRKIFTGRLTKDIKTLTGSFKQAAHKDEYIDTTDIRYREFSDLAEYFNKVLHERITTRNSLEDMNNELTQRVESEVKKNERNIQLLHEQKKLADMGQMINAIAHQWRQPLNNIHLINQMLQDIDSGDAYKMDKNLLYQQHSDLVDHMSKTIDDFRNYFSVNKKKHDFSVYEEIQKTVNLLQAQLTAINISTKIEFTDISKDSEKPDVFHGYAGEFRQIIMNLLSNAKDAIIDKRNHTGSRVPEQINIAIEHNKRTLTISISNTGSPIPPDVMSKIFNPYFTTKEEGKGTGIGLYLTKTIIENEMKGTITASSGQEGAVFTITLSTD